MVETFLAWLECFERNIASYRVENPYWQLQLFKRGNGK